MTTATARNITPPPEAFYFTLGERRVFKKKEKLTVSQWAERHRIITNGPITGQWRNEVTPYCVEPMDTLNLPWVRKVFLQWAPQIGKTQVAFNFLGYVIDQAPGPCMYVMPDEKVTKRISRRRIIPMFRGSPRIRELMSPRADDTTVLHVQFVTGMDLMMAWATSAAELASESVRYLIMDEVDKFPEFTGKEADPLSLAEIRTNAYPFTKKILLLSTPTVEGNYITKAMDEDADEVRDYHARCPVCAEYQIMAFDSISWGKSRDPREVFRGKLARYYCTKCGMAWDDYLRDRAVKAGKWIARMPVERPNAVGFHLSSWYSPFISLSAVAAAFLRGLDDPKKLMVFITQHKAEAWKETIIPKKESGVLEHREKDIPAGIVPSWAIALTVGIDVQKNGFWFVVRAWSVDFKDPAGDLWSHLVQYGYISTFADVESLIFNTRYQVQDSEETMGIWRAGIDTGGGETDSNEWTRTEEIYQWLRSVQPGRVFGTKGATHVRSLAAKRIKITRIDQLPRSNKPIPGGLELRLLDTMQYKSLIHWRMERKEGESQRFFLNADTGMDYAHQLLSEELARDRRGMLYWKQKHRNNHLLDCEVIAAACADSEWIPSLKMLAKHLSDRKDPAIVEKSRRRVISRGYGGDKKE